METEILTTLLWTANICIMVAVALNYFVIKSDLTNIKKLVRKVISVLMLIAVLFTFGLLIISIPEKTAEFLNINQLLLFAIFASQLVLSIIILKKITPFLDIFTDNREKIEAEENAFWCLLLFIALSTFVFIKYYGL